MLLAVPVWVEPSGSWLAEPDEARYAEIPREMIAARDFVTPRLNGVPYLEKPPLLYWANAASIGLFGQTPWAARLPTRLAGMGTVLFLVAGVAAATSVEIGLAAGIFYLASPLGFSLSRVNLTDGLLTFFFTAMLFGARGALDRREAGRPSGFLSATAGLGAAGAFLTKGLVGVALAGAILLAWCALTRRTRLLSALLVGPAVPVFLLAAAPWFILAERANPGFLRFFFIHEHFERFATEAARRPGAVYYFIPIFLAGFLPAIAFFLAAAAAPGRSARSVRGEPEALFYFLWFIVVFVFFSISKSKLPPYILPGFPAAVAFAALALFGPRPPAGAWRAQAILAALFVVGIALWPTARDWIGRYGLLPIAIGGAVALLAGTWTASALSRRSVASALAAFSVGWAGFGLMAALAWPKVPPATDLHNLEIAARDEATRGRAMVVGYQTYIQGLPWELKSPVPLADYVGELEPQFERRPDVRDALFWTREKFWTEWRSGRRYVAVIRQRDLAEFEGSGTPPRVIARGPKQFLLANYP